MAVAGVLKQRPLCRNGWIAERQYMGTEYSVCRYTGEILEGKERFQLLINPLARRPRLTKKRSNCPSPVTSTALSTNSSPGNRRDGNGLLATLANATKY